MSRTLILKRITLALMETKKHCFHEALKGVAIVDMKQPDGILFLGSVNSIDQISVINASIFSIFLD